MSLRPCLARATFVMLAVRFGVEPLAAQVTRVPTVAPPAVRPSEPTPTPSGPAPQNLRMLSGGPIVHTLTWERLPGVSGYTVAIRTATTAGQFVALTAQPILSENFVHRTLAQSNEVFRVTALYPDGRQGASEFTYANPPQPQVPAGFVAQQVGAGQVRLTWQPVQHAVSYRVFGSAQPRDGSVVGSTSMTLSNLPDGAHSWQVTADYGGVYAGAGLPTATVTLTTVVSGRYRVVANGFRVLHETVDDRLERDGKRDEVYGAFVALHFDRRTGRTLDQDLRRTSVLGDVTLPNRERAGSASSAGGLMTGDRYPDQSDPSRRNPAQLPGHTAMPFVVWEGTLTNAADAMVIIPTLWEWDNDQTVHDFWASGELNARAEIWGNPAVQLAAQGTTLALINAAGSMGADFSNTFSASMWMTFFTIGAPTYLAPLLAGSADRPIGFGLAGRPELPRRAVVLTREIIEATLNGPAVSGPRLASPANLWMLPYLSLSTDIISVVLMDDVVSGHHLNGVYVLYLQVERVP